MANRHGKKALKKDISVYKVAFFLGICLFSMIFLSSNTKASIIINETFETDLSNWTWSNGLMTLNSLHKIGGSKSANISGALWAVLNPYYSNKNLSYPQNNFSIEVWTYSAGGTYQYPTLNIQNKSNSLNAYNVMLVNGSEIQLVNWLDGSYAEYIANNSCVFLNNIWYKIIMNISRVGNRDIIDSRVINNNTGAVCSASFNTTSNLSSQELFGSLGNLCLGNCQNFYDNFVVYSTETIIIIGNISINMITPQNNTFFNITTINSTIPIWASVISNETIDKVIFEITLPNNTQINYIAQNTTFMYDAMIDEPNTDGIPENFAVFAGDSNTNLEYDTDWRINKPNTEFIIDRINLVHYNTLGFPKGENFIYNISMCKTNVINLTSSTNHTIDCINTPVVVAQNINLSYYLGNHSTGEQTIIPFDISYNFSRDASHILMFDYVSGGKINSINDFWRIRTDATAIPNFRYRRTLGGSTLLVSNIVGDIDLTLNNSYGIRFNKTDLGGTYKIKIYANDTAGRIAINTSIFNIDLVPDYSNFNNNETAQTPKFNQTINWSITLKDDFNVSSYLFMHTSNGSLVSDSLVLINGSFKEINISIIKNITAPKGFNVCANFTIYDNGGNIKETNSSCFIVKNTAPIVILDKPSNNSNLSINSAVFNWSATDIDINDTISQHNMWMSTDGGLTYSLKYNGGNPTILLNNLQTGIIYWFASSYDGTDWGNSSIFKLNVGSPVLNITARDYISNASITSFTAVLTAPNGTQIIKSTTSKSIIFNLTYEVWNYTISASGYTDTSGNINMIDGNKNLTAYMQLPATINVNIYNENFVLANNTLTSLLFISETQAYSVSYITSNGTLYIPYIPSDSYQLKYNATNYRNGVYYFNINTTTSAFIKLYLIPINNTNQIFITLYDINGNSLEGYIIKALRFNTGTNNWEFYQMSKTDDNGIATMFFTPFDNYYEFVVEKDGIVYLATSPRLVYADFSLIINPSRIDVLPMLTASNIAYNLSYDDSGAGFFRFQYNDLNNIVVKGCLNVKNPLSSQYLCSQCSDSTSAVLICSLNASNSSVLLAQGIITYLTDDYTIATLEKNFRTDYQTFGAGGIFYVAFLVLALSLLALWHPIVAIAMAIIAMILSGIIGLFYLTFTAGVVLVILGFIYMVLMRK